MIQTRIENVSYSNVSEELHDKPDSNARELSGVANGLYDETLASKHAINDILFTKMELPQTSSSMNDQEVEVSNTKRKAWAIQEDEALKNLVPIYGLQRWVFISKELAERYNFPKRTGKQCRERYF